MQKNSRALKRGKANKKVRKGDKVYVISGAYKGTIGEVLSRTDLRVVVKGVNIRTKHNKKRAHNQPGSISNFEAPIDISNVALCPNESHKEKVRIEFNDQNDKELVSIHDGQRQVLRSIK